MSETFAVGVKIDQNHCSRCAICPSVCPFEAISIKEKTGEVKLDIEKCQTCGICSSSCPVLAIETVYYETTSLLSYVERRMRQTGFETLVVMCRGSSSQSKDIANVLEEQNIHDFISLRLPCVGRLSSQFFVKALALGVKKIVVVECEDYFCRFKEGSKVATRRLLATGALLDQLGFNSGALAIIRNPLKAVYETKECVGCGKCEYICPYDAIKLDVFGTPQIDSEACMGCGACAVICPHLAFQLEGYRYEAVSNLIQDYSMKANRLKSDSKKPVILVFCCQWSEFSALNNPKTGVPKKNVMIVEIPCFTGLDPTHVLRAFYLGFDGVLVITCPEDECKLKEGREIAEQNVSALRKMLKQFNLENRFEICTASPKYLGEFDSKIDAFVQKISSLPPIAAGERLFV
ncbi:MAG: hydrogenase iron-sulfur subunit [Thermoproteota archaeon]|nr:hydrogenase iron-sulfur subunit [Thermoproteota archaeon]